MGKVIELNKQPFTALEFFSGIGLARAGECVTGTEVLTHLSVSTPPSP